MIRITRINGNKIILNAELIQHIEATPDTVITLVGGKTYMVKESVKMIVNRVLKYKRSIYNQNKLIKK